MMSHLRRFAGRFHQDTTGAMSVEKILILALIALPILIILLIFRKKIVDWFGTQDALLVP